MSPPEPGFAVRSPAHQPAYFQMRMLLHVTRLYRLWKTVAFTLSESGKNLLGSGLSHRAPAGDASADVSSHPTLTRARFPRLLRLVVDVPCPRTDAALDRSVADATCHTQRSHRC